MNREVQSACEEAISARWPFAVAPDWGGVWWAVAWRCGPGRLPNPVGLEPATFGPASAGPPTGLRAHSTAQYGAKAIRPWEGDLICPSSQTHESV